MRKKLEVELDLQMMDFNQKMDQIEKRMKKLDSPVDRANAQSRNSQMGQQMGVPMSGPGAQQHQAVTQARLREQEKILKDQLMSQDKLTRSLKERYETEKKLVDLISRQVALGKDAVRLEENLERQRSRTRMEEAKFDRQQASVDNNRQSYTAAGGLPPPPNGGGGQTLGQAVGGISATRILKGVAVAAAFATAMDNYNAMPMQRSHAAANATQDTIGTALGDLDNGKTITNSAFSSERQKASQMAQERMNSRGTWGAMGNITDILKDAAHGNFSQVGMSANNVMGSVERSAADYAHGSGLASGIKGITGFDLEGSLRKRSDMNTSTYQTQLMEMYGQDYQSNLAAEKKKNPFKNEVANRYQQSYMGDLSNQRRMGLSDTGYYGRGGFEETMNKGQFNSDLGNNMASQISGAGGSTRGQDKSTTLLGLQASRMDMTNSGSLLGQISAGAGSSQATNAIFKKLLEESVKDGLDNSEYREEQRKFGELQANALSAGGVSSEKDAQSVLAGLSSYLAKNPSMKDVAGAGNAYDQGQRASAETGGRGGALQMANMIRDPVLSKIGYKGYSHLMEMQENQINETDPYLISQASKAGVSPAELKDRLLKEKGQKKLQDANLDPGKVDKLHDYFKKIGKDVKSASTDDINNMPTDMKNFYRDDFMPNLTMKGDMSNPQTVTAKAQGALDYKDAQNASANPDLAKQVDQRLANGSNRGSDNVVAATGLEAEGMLVGFRKFKDELVPAASAVKAFVEALVSGAIQVGGAPDQEKAPLMSYWSQKIGNTPSGAAPKVQPTASKPKPGN